MNETSSRYMEVTLIRHAATAGNLARRYIGSTDEPLSEPGIAAASELALRLAGSHPDLVYASPLRRCIATASIIYPSITPIVLDDLRETSFGPFEGRTFDELKDDPSYRLWLDTNGDATPPGCESMDAVRERVLSAWSCINADAQASRVAVVAHGGTIMTLMQYHLGGSLFDWQVRNCGGFVVSISGRRRGVAIRGTHSVPSCQRDEWRLTSKFE